MKMTKLERILVIAKARHMVEGAEDLFSLLQKIQAIVEEVESNE